MLSYVNVMIWFIIFLSCMHQKKIDIALYRPLATVVACPTVALRKKKKKKKKHFYRVTLLVSFLGQIAKLLDPPIRRKIKAPLGFYSVTSAHAVELF